MRHLEHLAGVWCEVDEIVDSTDDPRDATCAQCLRRAAAYGAAAAMRGAAVEAGVTQDPELVRERDEAIRKLGRMSAQLERQGAFFCTGCEVIKAERDCALQVENVSWCRACAPGTRKAVT